MWTYHFPQFPILPTSIINKYHLNNNKDHPKCFFFHEEKVRAIPITHGTKPSAFNMVTFPKFSCSKLHGSNTKGLPRLASCLQFGRLDEHKFSPAL